MQYWVEISNNWLTEHVSTLQGFAAILGNTLVLKLFYTYSSLVEHDDMDTTVFVWFTVFQDLKQKKFRQLDAKVLDKFKELRSLRPEHLNETRLCG